MESEMVRDVFRAMYRAIAADLSLDAEFRSHKAACEIGNRHRRPIAFECLCDPDTAPHLTRWNATRQEITAVPTISAADRSAR